jgi:phosphoribosylanthranilate isomerase
MSDSSRLWVKICGNTSAADARLAADAGADAVGFVFASSPRQVTHAQAAAITAELPEETEKIGVFVDSKFEEISSIVRATRFTGVQLHFDAPPGLPARLRDEFGPQLRILCVVHFGAEAATQSEAIASDPNVDAILVDSRTATASGGTGVSFDWALARHSIFHNAEAQKRLVAAGGLSPANVADAIRTLRPWGVDVVSGVEAVPGRKDPLKVRDFVARARACAAESNQA